MLLKVVYNFVYSLFLRITITYSTLQQYYCQSPHPHAHNYPHPLSCYHSLTVQAYLTSRRKSVSLLNLCLEISRMNINAVGGQYLDSAGRRVRRWHWKSSDSKQPCVQFKPIFISLNLRVGVRIIAQDKIYVSFLAMGKQAKFSVGRKELKKSQVRWC